MSAQLEAYVTARDKVLRAALDSLRAERGLADGGSVLTLTDADAGLCVAARDLARTVEDLPRERKPKGWAES